MLSIIAIAKGAIFLAKSSAVKAAIAKCGSYMIGHYGLASTATVAIHASAITGTVLTVTSTAEKAKDGYCNIVEGLMNRSYSKFCEGVAQLSKAGMTAGSIIEDFDDFVDGLNLTSDVKISLKKSMSDLEELIYDRIEYKVISLLKEAEELLRQSGRSKEVYLEEVNAIYYKHLCDIKNDDYLILLGRAGRIYSDICDLNLLSGVRRNNEGYDHYLVYCIAGWMKDHLSLQCLNAKSQKQIADDITNNILYYLRMTD